MGTKKELLERVLLMMKYDSSRTLNENKKEIRVISEQRIADLKKIPENPQIKAAKLRGEKVEEIPYTTPERLNWLNHQAESKSAYYKYPYQDFENVLFNFLNDISKMTLQQLVDFQLSYKRSITPGFIGFGKGSFADALVDNEIYLRRMKGEKGYPTDDWVRARGQKPDIDKPEYSLFKGDVFLRFSPYIGKGAKQITTEMTKSYTDSVKTKNEKKAIDSGCPFKNKTEGDAFRVWFNDNYPKFAVKMDLDRDGDFCNSYIKKVANSTFKDGEYINKKVKDVYIESTIEKKKHEEFLTNLKNNGPINPMDGGIRMYDDSGELNRYFNSNDEIQFKKMSDEMEKYTAQNFDLSGLDDVLKRNNMTKFNVDITATADATRTKYDSPKQGKGWIEPKTKIFVPKYVLDQGKYAVTSYLREVLDEKKQIENENKISNSKLIKQLFKQEEIDYAFENCIKDNVIAFFQEILDGKKKNKQGKVVGKWYNDSKGNPYMAKWDSTKIPCDTQFWMDYGVYIQLGGMVAIALLSGGLGLGPSATLFLELAADTALNLYSLKKSVDAQDDDAIKMDLAYVFLPLLMAAGPVKAALKNAKFGDEVIESVETKLKTLPPNATKTQVDDLLKNMTPQEQRVIDQLGKEEYKDVVQKASKDIVDGLKKTADAPIIRKLSNPLVNILVYGAPAGAFFVKKISDSFKQKTGKSLTQKENELWGKALAFLDEESQSDLTTWMQNASKEQLLDIQNSPQMKSALLRTQNPENLSMDEINKAGQEILDVIKLLEEKTKLDLKTKESENEDLDFDEYDTDEWDKILGGTE